MLCKVFRQRSVLLTTYGMVLHNASLLARTPGKTSMDDEDEEERGALWDVMILDEVRAQTPGCVSFVSGLHTLCCHSSLS